MRSLYFGNLGPASPKVMYADAEYKGAPDQTDPFDGTTKVIRLPVQRTADIRPKYGTIPRESLNGNMRPLHMAGAFGLYKSQADDDIYRSGNRRSNYAVN